MRVKPKMRYLFTFHYLKYLDTLGEGGRPNTWNWLPTKLTSAIFYVILQDRKTSPPDQKFSILGTISVLTLVAGHVANVNIVQTYVLGYFPGLLQCSNRCRGEILQLILRIESSKMKRYIHSQIIPYPLAHGLYHLWIIIKGWNHEVGNL